MEIKNLLVLLPLYLLLTACGVEVQDKDQDDAAEAAPPAPMVTATSAPTINKENLKIQLQGAQPYKYDLHFSWPKVPGKIVIADETETWAELDASLGQFKKTSLSSNKVFAITVNHYDASGNLIGSQERKMTIPQDLVLASMDLYKDSTYTAHRIFLMENSVVTTGPFSLNLQAEEIHFINATVRSFPDEARAGTSTHGRTGGAITLKATAAFGKVSILLRGESGGHGLDGLFIHDKSLGCPGGPGGNGGASAALTTFIQESSHLEMNYSSQPGKPGFAGKRNTVTNPNQAYQEPQKCSPLATNSPDGLEGSVGPVKIN